MKIAWTTVATASEAEQMACALVAAGLAVCVQIEGPLRSHYRWEGKVETSAEHRLTLKCLDENLPALEAAVLARHPYAVPEWIVVDATRVGEKYLSWARSGRQP
ncbi:MAG: divalent-cation tolerance protein CutA [Opitutaceae bacterium]